MSNENCLCTKHYNKQFNHLVLSCRCYYHPHFTDENTEAQLGWIAYLRSHSWEAAGLGFKTRQSGFRPLLLATVLGYLSG